MARILDQVRGHQSQIQSFLAGSESDHLASSFLFVGPKGVGKGLIARGLAQALVCERSQRACGDCPSCVRVASETSEALIVVEPETQGGQIKVEVSRQILKRLSLQTAGRSQVVIIEEAHHLNVQAANALLKVIEEPPENCYFFLIAPSATSVLGTIRSRCQTFRFGPLTAVDLQAVSGEKEHWRVLASRGSLSRLKELKDETLLEVRQMSANILWWALYDEASFSDSGWRKALKDKTSIGLITDYMAVFLRDALIVQQGGTKILNADFEELISGLAESSRIESLATRISGLERALKGNAEPQLAFEKYFFAHT